MAGGSSGKSETEMRINFAALKKIDENIEHIIDTASSVAHYKFNSGSGVWVSITKSSIEVLIIACFGQSNVMFTTECWCFVFSLTKNFDIEKSKKL